MDLPSSDGSSLYPGGQNFQRQVPGLWSTKQNERNAPLFEVKCKKETGIGRIDAKNWIMNSKVFEKNERETTNLDFIRTYSSGVSFLPLIYQKKKEIPRHAVKGSLAALTKRCESEDAIDRGFDACLEMIIPLTHYNHWGPCDCPVQSQPMVKFEWG